MEPVTGFIRVLGIETSCDETAAAIVELDAQGGGKILSNVILSQIADHAEFGGVVPEIAARAHVEALDGIIAQALVQAGTDLNEIGSLAATGGPGLAGGLIVGLMTAKAISAARSIPLFCINHLEGHALTARLTDGLEFPYLLLLVSGGHTQIIAVNNVGDYRRYATTIDDALGEAFDKTAKLLGLPHPGGPNVENAALGGDPSRIPLPRPMKGDKRPDFSFSGLKTAVRQAATALAPLKDRDISDLCASFQTAVTESVADRVLLGMNRFRKENSSNPAPVLVAAGGVAANNALRSQLETLAAAQGFRFVAPPQALCSDNAVMIAWAAIERIRAGLEADGSNAVPRPRWPLDEMTEPVFGFGKRGAKA